MYLDVYKETLLHTTQICVHDIMLFEYKFLQCGSVTLVLKHHLQVPRICSF